VQQDATPKGKNPYSSLRFLFRKAKIKTVFSIIFSEKESIIVNWK
jgi:hypothetical protein